jgi:hypothetical protein
LGVDDEFPIRGEVGKSVEEFGDPGRSAADPCGGGVDD